MNDGWMVFGRTDYAEPLRSQGRVEAADEQDATNRALEHYGRDWVELTLVPEGSIRWVLQRTEDEQDER